MSRWQSLKTTALAALLVIGGAQAGAARTVEHAMGRTETPEAPRRVVVLTNEGTEAALVLGVKPIGAVKSWLGDPWYDHIAKDMQGVQVVGTESGVNLEVIASLRPDLILGNKQRQEAIYPQLSKIAPTVLSTALRGDWQKNLTLYAQALGKTAEGKAALDRFEARTKAIAGKLGGRLEERVSLVRFLPGLTRIYYTDTFAGTILGQIGLQRPKAQSNAEFAADVTKERIPEMDGDRLFYFVYETGEGNATKAETEWTAEPLWKSLNAVKLGRVHRVSDAIWNTAGGVIAANAMLDDLERFYGLR